jgi:hypothetical protein
MNTERLLRHSPWLLLLVWGALLVAWGYWPIQ